MRSFEELETLWRKMPRSPRDRGTVELIVIRPTSGERDTPERVEVSPELGVHGDRWSKSEQPDRDMQLSLMNSRVGELVAHGQPPALFGDNFLVDLDLSAAALPVGTRLRMGTALIEVSPHPHTPCKKYRARFGAPALRWVNHRPNRDERLRGVHCRIVEAGVVAVGDTIELAG